MPHRLPLLLEATLNRAHLITPTALAPIISYLTDRTYHTPNLATGKGVEHTPRKPKQIGAIAELSVDGALTYKPISAACSPEGCSYQSLIEQCASLIDSGVSTIIMTHSSPGGEANHAFSCANDIKSMCEEADVQLISYIDTMSASASYLLACVADVVVIHPEASCGSIGAVVALKDVSKALDMAGVKPVYITSVEGKVPFDEAGKFTSEFITEMQEEVTRLGLQFSEHVSIHTGVPVKDILAMNAKMFSAPVALEKGLVNLILDHKQFAQYLQDNTGVNKA